MQGKEEEFYPLIVVALLLCCMAEFEQHIPLFLVRTCKNQQAKACWKCYTTQQS
jgi:hypothetical protein